MTEQINHRYVKDADGDLYFPVTHVDAVLVIDVDGTNTSISDINDKIAEVNNTLSKANETIAAQQKVIEQQTKDIQTLNTGLFAMVDDSGWQDYQVANATKDGGFSGFSCQIREVVIGLSKDKFARIRTVRVNLGNCPHNIQVAQLPTGFIDDTIRFIGSSNSGIPAPIISVNKSGQMLIFFDSNYRDGKQNVYGQHTWLVKD